MAIRKLKTRVLEVSRRGRIQLFKNSWFTPVKGLLPIQRDRVYQFVIDDSLMVISEARDPRDSELTRDYISDLQDTEIERLNALCELNTEFITSLPVHLRNSYSRLVARAEIDKDSSISEIAYHREIQQASRDTRYSVKHLSRVTSDNARGFTTYREDIALDRLKTGNMTPVEVHEYEYGI